ncbi:ABC transporter ATP-binding protein [Streptococcus mutans]|uniref:ABC transporter MutF n=1 Tax=Streptococcus mutans TaxID=1309 RepID=Q9Z6E0_STRMG|nr:ATP-binding cassette domain-containing protein [Streptococcus mutans]AAD16030.1 ABC transporter MutF [Streptococcus mutans]EMC02706.1 ABC transporter, ATP-binding protein [Streptococcus mutans N34]MBT3148482.1 ATP-binding cassette domain-containing protein [Streptococcus mutans]MBW3480171.1 ATP-binding cassette domain-containing protein [Streptococcus mutans]MCB4931656.1 ATP-binding cassette domain-containing protein [Streptococcus mutans]
MTKPLLSINNLSKSFGNQKVLDHLNMTISPGEIYGFLGVNGAGKSTAMKIILGLLPKDSGEIVALGRPLPENRSQILPEIGALIEEPAFYPNLTGFENLQLIQELANLPKDNIKVVMEATGIYYAKDKLVRNYSLGMKQRLGISMALIKFPKFLILDEPTNGLDPDGIHQMRQLIRSLPQKFNMTILISSHILSEIENLADTVGIIKDGHLIYEGGINQLLNQEQKYQLKVNNLEKAAQIIQHYDNKIGIVKNDDDILLISLPDCTLVPDLIAQLVYNELQIYEIYGVKKTLESVFLDLTKE